MNYTVEVAADVDGIPHSFLVVKDESGTVVYARGFAPEETGLWGVGKINDDIDHPFSNTSGTLAVLDENGFNNLKTIISGYENNPPYYNLLLGSQCTVWTLQVLKEANILSFAPSTNFTLPLVDIVENLVYNPYFQAAYFKLKEIANDIVTAITPTQPSLNEIMETEYQLTKLYNAGSLSSSFYNDFTQNVSDYLVSDSFFNPNVIIDVPNIYDGFDGLSLNPIGAFYESVTPANDPALSIADKTFVVLDSTNKGITATALSLKDTNHDGKLSGTELSGLNMWRDLNENGVAESGEITTLSPKKITSIRAEDYGMYTQGNAKFASAVITAPTKINTIQNVPASNFRTLRDTDNVYYVGGGRINWAKNQIKINYSNRSYLIGTDGNDTLLGYVNNQNFKKERRIA